MPRRGGRAGRPAAGLAGTPAWPAGGRPAPLAPSANRPLPAGEGPGARGLVLLGEFGRAHGLRGEVRLKSYTADPLAIAGYGPLVATDGRRFELASVRPAAGDAPDLLVARIEGVTSREQAEALTRVGLFVDRAQLAPPDEDEFYLADLVGLDAVDGTGRQLGRVAAVPDYGGGPLLDIAPVGGGPTVLVPFTRAFAPVVDLAGRRLVLAAPDLFAPPEPRDPA